MFAQKVIQTDIRFILLLRYVPVPPQIISKPAGFGFLQQNPAAPVLEQ